MSTYTFTLPFFRASDQPFSVMEEGKGEVAVIWRTYSNPFSKGMEYALRNRITASFTPVWIDTALDRWGVQAKMIWKQEEYLIKQQYGLVLDHWHVMKDESIVGVIRQADLLALGDMLEIAWDGETYVMEREILHHKTHVYRAEQVEVATIYSHVLDVKNRCQLTVIEEGLPAPVLALAHYLNYVKGLY